MRQHNGLSLQQWLRRWRLVRWKLYSAALLLLLVSLGRTPAWSAPRISALSQAAVPTCQRLLINGGFETLGQAWELFSVDRPPQYVSEPVYAGQRAMSLGILDQANTPSISAIQQTVDLPQDADSIVLNFHYFPRHEANPGNDLQYVDIYNGFTNQLIVRKWTNLSDERAWKFTQIDLSELQGLRVRIFFAVTNDGAGGRTALFLDEVDLVACDTTPADGTASATPTASPTAQAASPTATVTPPDVATGLPTGTPTATAPVTPLPLTVSPTPTPSSTPAATPLPAPEQHELVVNGSFESEQFWILGDSPIPPRYTSADRFSGASAMGLGNPPELGLPDRLSYSSVRQLVTIPSNVATAQLRWRHRTFTQQLPDPAPNRQSDRQELILLRADLRTMRILWRELRTDSGWAERVIDMTPFRGETFYIYFNVYNDGNGLRTWMFLDDVSLRIAYAGTPDTPVAADPLLPTPPASVTPTATPTAAESLSGAALLATAAALSTLAAGTPTVDAERRSVGEETVPSSRALPLPQATPSPTTPPERPHEVGVELGQLGPFVVLLVSVIGMIIVVLIVVAVARRFGRTL